MYLSKPNKEIFKDLKFLKVVEIDNHKVVLTFKDIRIKYESRIYCFGDFEVSIDLDTYVDTDEETFDSDDLGDYFNIKRLNTDEHCFHPHIDLYSKCLGTFARPLLEYMNDNDWLGIVLTLKRFLESYTDGDNYKSITRFIYDEGIKVLDLKGKEIDMKRKDICPHCLNEMKELLFDVSVSFAKRITRTDIKNKEDLITMARKEMQRTAVYPRNIRCPHCNNKVAESEAQALEILGKKPSKIQVPRARFMSEREAMNIHHVYNPHRTSGTRGWR